MILVGLTGGIASGKTTACKIISKCGLPIISADEISHKLTREDCTILKEIESKFGKGVLEKDGSLNRKKMASIIFNDRKKRELLNKIIHPVIINSINSEIKRLKKRQGMLVIIEAALLFESEYDKMVDHKLVIAVDPSVQIRRLQERDSITKEETLRRINSQISQEERINHADFVIYNNGDLSILEFEVINALAFVRMQNERNRV